MVAAGPRLMVAAGLEVEVEVEASGEGVGVVEEVGALVSLAVKMDGAGWMGCGGECG
jgi:hypothetical protein